MNLILAPDARLRQVCAAFNFDQPPADPYVLSQAMLAEMKLRRGVGLAAPQIGRPLRLFVVRAMGGEGVALFNPELIAVGGGQAVDKEGCLSFPGIFAPVKRHQQAYVRYQDWRGDVVETAFLGMDARCVQHEMDHLEGITLDVRAPQAFLAARAMKSLRDSRRR